MLTLALYFATATIFLVLDAVMLKLFLQPLFKQHLGTWLLEEIRFGPAVIFYLLYIAGLVWLVSNPALRAGAPVQALIGGAILGAMAYGTYEFTNFATLRAWNAQMVTVDLIWGTVLTGFSAWAGVTIVRAFA